MIIRSAALALAACCTFGCATKFSDTEFPRTNTDIEILSLQPEITVNSSSGAPMAMSGALVGGFIGGVLMASAQIRANQGAEREFVVLQDKLSNYPVSQRFADHIKRSDVLDRLVSESSTIIHREIPQNNDQTLERPVFRIEPAVAFSNDLTTLIVGLSVTELIPYDSGISPRNGVSQHYEFRWPLEESIRMGQAEAAATWNARPTNELVELIEFGMETTLDMLRAHIEELDPRMADTVTPRVIHTPGLYRLWRQSGQLLWLVNLRGNSPFFAVPEHALLNR